MSRRPGGNGPHFFFFFPQVANLSDIADVERLARRVLLYEPRPRVDVLVSL